jgi:hypothetical protein
MTSFYPLLLPPPSVNRHRALRTDTFPLGPSYRQQLDGGQAESNHSRGTSSGSSLRVRGTKKSLAQSSRKAENESAMAPGAPREQGQCSECSPFLFSMPLSSLPQFRQASAKEQSLLELPPWFSTHLESLVWLRFLWAHC